MSNIKKRHYVLLSNWQGQYLKCACLFHNPCCNNTSKCEEIEVSLSPYEDIEECMKHSAYKKVNGVIRQVK